METAMATAAKAVEYPHIVKTTDVRGGKAQIDGTRICVVDVMAVHQQNLKPEEILTHFSSRPLTLAEVYSALAYYHDHRDEIEAYFERSSKTAKEFEAERAEYLSRRPDS